MVSLFCMTEWEMVSKQMVVAYFQVLPKKNGLSKIIKPSVQPVSLSSQV
jgi:hypothetical protein